MRLMMFNHFKKIVSNFRASRPLDDGLQVDQQFDNNDIEAAADNLSGSERTRANADNAMSNADQRIGQSITSASEIIENAKSNADQFTYGRALQTAHQQSQDFLKQASLTNDPKELAALQSTYQAQNTGFLQTLKSKLPTESYQSLENAVNQKQSIGFQYVQNKRSSIAANIEYDNLKGSFEQVVRQVVADRQKAGDDLKKLGIATQPLTNWVEKAHKLSDSGFLSDSQLTHLHEQMQKALNSHLIEQHIDHANTNYVTNSKDWSQLDLDISSRANTTSSVLKQFTTGDLSFQNAAYQLPFDKNYFQNIQQLHQIGAVKSTLMESPHIIEDATRFANDPNNPAAAQTAKYALSEINKGNGLQLMAQFDPHIKQIYQDWKSGKTSYHDFALAIENRAASLNIPVDKIHVLPSDIKEATQAAFASAYIRNAQGQITSVSSNAWGGENNSQWKPNTGILGQLESNAKLTGGVTFGHDDAQKYYNILPQSQGKPVDESYAVNSALSFQKEAQDWANKQNQLFTDSHGKPLSGQYKNPTQLKYYIRENLDNNISQLSALSGISKGSLLNSLTYQAISQVAGNENPTKSDWNQAISYITDQTNHLLQNQQAHVGKVFFGPHYAISPTVLNHFVSKPLNDNEITGLVSGLVDQAITHNTNRFLARENAAGESSALKDVADSEKEQMAKMHALTPEDYSVVSRNGQLFIHRIDGWESAVDPKSVEYVMHHLGKYQVQLEADQNGKNSAVTYQQKPWWML